MADNLEKWNTNIKNGPPFDHVIPILDIYRKKIDILKDWKKLLKFITIKKRK